MSGIYIHIPFCRQPCSYCNFHFTVNLQHKDAFLQSLMVEVDLRKEYLKGAAIETIYLGGGTPSLLSADEVKILFEKIYQTFSVSENAEVTLEANPDDLSAEKIKELRATPVNRLSIGIQSFDDGDLKLLNRAHHAQQAETSVKMAQDAGFENITVDLIYGLPEKIRGTGDGGRGKEGKDSPFDTHSSLVPRPSPLSDKWLINLTKLHALRIPHFSAYCLTIEPKTILEKMIREKKSPGTDDALAAQQFEMLMDFAAQHGYDHYEISNFAKEQRYSRHNTSYWTGKHYLGMGPSAHSYDGESRQWNITNTALYIQSLQQGGLNFEKEQLTGNDRYNEYVMTSLRTRWGVDMGYVKAHFGDEKSAMLEKNALKFFEEHALARNDETITLTRKGKLIADRIICDLFAER